jgi:hypothetical protein
MARTFKIKGGSVQQGPVNQFFYVAGKDVVYLFIWSASPSGVNTRMEVRINDGSPKHLKDFGNGRYTSWNNVDITEVVRQSSSLDVEQFPGIGENVYNIKITPIPTVSQRSVKQAEEEIELYALVIVRRSQSIRLLGVLGCALFVVYTWSASGQAEEVHWQEIESGMLYCATNYSEG